MTNSTVTLKDLLGFLTEMWQMTAREIILVNECLSVNSECLLKEGRGGKEIKLLWERSTSEMNKFT